MFGLLHYTKKKKENKLPLKAFMDWDTKDKKGLGSNTNKSNFNLIS